jgi:hypothetical protein
MWSTREELQDVLVQAGLGEWSSRLAAASRHAMVLEPGPVEGGADVPIGVSRLGGMPDLPAAMRWPWRPAMSAEVFKEHAAHPWPLSFVAQIDFAEIHSAGGLEGFPSSGRLLFFCDPIFSSIGGDREDQVFASVIFLGDEVDRLGRRDFPVEFANPAYGLPGNFMFRPRRMTPKPWLLPPPFGSRELGALDGVPPPLDWRGRYPKCWGEPEDKAFTAYRRFWTDLAEKHPNSFSADGAIHQVGGIAFAWQDPIETDCVKYADDDYLNPPTVKAFDERVQKDGAAID